MSGYTKLFQSILASTIWDESNDTRIVWITLLAMADKYGRVEGSVPGLAVFARLPVPATRRALARLMAPDKDSRSKEQDGRRIMEIEGGWHLVNHAKYREKMGADERREYLKLKQREYRRKHPSTTVNNVSDTDTASTHASPSPSPKASPSLEKRARGVSAEDDAGKDIGKRAGVLIEHYAAWYSQYRHGAKLRLIGNSLEFQDACSLCETWEDQRLEKLARIVLTTDDDFISGTDRGFKIFALKASWADDRLRQAEKAVAS